MSEVLALIPQAAETVFAAGGSEIKAVALCGKDCAQADFFVRVMTGCGFAVAADAAIKVNYSVLPESGLPSEGYRLTVGAAAIDITAADEGGLLYGFVTLAQLIFNYEGVLPAVTVTDYPETAYRGLMVDVARYFFGKEDIKRFADFCALNKLNKLHLHLTDDQGWRMPVKKYPLLTEKGGFRSHTNFGFRPHGGFYTEEELKEIIAYCNSLNIEVIPEIDMPGHMQAALAAYPALGCFGRKLNVATHSGVKHDVLCAGKESTYRFIFDVLDEVMEIFGGNTKYIHIGGDEVSTHRWKLCPDCKKKAAELKLGGVDELQSYFLNRVAEYAVAGGYTPVMWNESEVSGSAPASAVWQYWTDDGAEKEKEILSAASLCGGVINSSSKHCYMDFPYAYIDLERAYEYDPRPECVPSNKFVGGEIALWTEYVPDFRTACLRLLPRSLALSEAMWRGRGDYGDFLSRTEKISAFMREEGFEGASPACASPGKSRAFIQKLWFERRQLHWQGLHNLIDDIAVAKRYGKRN